MHRRRTAAMMPIASPLPEPYPRRMTVEAARSEEGLTSEGPSGADAPRPRFERRKQGILQAAGVSINRHGLRDATLSIVASEIGLNLKSLRHYYRRREDLVADAFLASIALHQRLVEDAYAETTTEGRLRTFVTRYFDLLESIYRGDEIEFVNFGDIRALTDPHRGVVASAYVDLFRATRRLFDKEVGLVAEQRNANALMVLAQLHWAVVWIGNYVPDDFARVAARLLDVLLFGMSNRPTPEEAAPSTPRTLFVSTDRLSQESFLRAATELINETGYRGASVERISSKLKVTKGSFYHHNETRDQLVVACFERSFAVIREAQDRAVASQAYGLAHVAAAATSLVTRQMVPGGALLRTSALTAIGPDLRSEMQRHLSLSTNRFADMLNDGLIDGSVRLCDVRIAAEMVTGLVNSAQELQQWVASAGAENADALYVRPLLHGLLATA